MSILPTIHTNGTSASELDRQQRAVGHAAYALLEALADASPNARDYYPQSDGAFAAATATHQKRVDAVRAILADVELCMEMLVNHA
jgi:hypothetical protein